MKKIDWNKVPEESKKEIRKTIMDIFKILEKSDEKGKFLKNIFKN